MPYPFRPRSPLCDSHAEEVANTATHAFGLLLSVAGLIGMLIAARGDPWRVVSAAVFGSTLVLLYGSSTVYHAITGPRWKSALQTLDHACIYLLIAGSYTPLTLVSLRGPWGWSLFGVIWGLAVAGVCLKFVVRGRKDNWLSTALYLVMGWLAVLAIGPLVKSLGPAGLAWLAAGGLCYTLGIVFFAWEKLPFNHAIWHVFVLAGSACHVAACTWHVLR